MSWSGQKREKEGANMHKNVQECTKKHAKTGSCHARLFSSEHEMCGMGDGILRVPHGEGRIRMKKGACGGAKNRGQKEEWVV